MVADVNRRASTLLGKKPHICWLFEYANRQWRTLADMVSSEHPSYLLRFPEETSRQREFLRFVKDLQGAKSWLACHRKRAI
jgi:hypothetical protein